MRKSLTTAVLMMIAGSQALASPADDLTFPLRPTSDHAEVLELVPVPELIAELESRESVTLVDVALPGVAPATLDLERIPFAPDGINVHVDGKPTSSDTSHLQLSLWKGKVRGDESSNVFLSFSAFGSRGWIEQGGETFHLTVRAGDDNAWDRSRNTIVRESTLHELGVTPEFDCKTDRVTHPGQPSLPVPQGRAPEVGFSGSAPLPYYNLRIALETDFQLYQLFNNLAATQAYTFSLFGAISDRYREQVGAIFTMPYVAFYTSNNDPWVSQDFGGGSLDVLFEFTDAWDFGAAPVSADLYAMWSGAGLGGGVAYLDVLCNPDFSFSVTGNLAALTPIPIIPGNPFNWDFVASAHELGHNVATPHTHDFCPPIDQCAPDGFFGVCQTAEVCTPVGTIMGYCHLCDGGFENVTTFFHPEVVNTMRSGIVTSCAPLFAGVFTEDLGFAKAGAGGVPNLDVTFTSGSNTLALEMTSLTAGVPGLVYLSGTTVNAPFKGGTLVPAPDLSFSLAPGGTSQNLGGTVTGIPEGINLVAQAWFKDGSLWSATNAVAFELIVP